MMFAVTTMMLMMSVMMFHIISEYLGNPTPVRGPWGAMKCSSNKQTSAHPVTSSLSFPRLDLKTEVS